MKKKTIMGGLLSGAVFAGLMAAFDWNDNQSFSLFKFIFHMLFFGLLQGIIIFMSLKKQNQSRDDKL